MMMIYHQPNLTHHRVYMYRPPCICQPPRSCANLIQLFWMRLAQERTYTELTCLLFFSRRHYVQFVFFYDPSVDIVYYIHQTYLHPIVIFSLISEFNYGTLHSQVKGSMANITTVSYILPCTSSFPVLKSPPIKIPLPESTATSHQNDLIALSI